MTHQHHPLLLITLSSFTFTSIAFIGDSATAQNCANYWINPATNEEECFGNPRNLRERTIVIDPQEFMSYCSASMQEEIAQPGNDFLGQPTFYQPYCQCMYTGLVDLPPRLQTMINNMPEDQIFDLPEMKELAVSCTFSAGRSLMEEECIQGLSQSPDMAQVPLGPIQQYCKCAMDKAAQFMTAYAGQYNFMEEDIPQLMASSPVLQAELLQCVP